VVVLEVRADRVDRELAAVAVVVLVLLQ